ncbi:MAG: GguC family protein [Alphaproteobacteria bacterium]|jgi:hypothetical protein|nr:GguC family protein [Alphaproteobacteria bacterium]
MRLLQFETANSERRVGVAEESGARFAVLAGTERIYDLAIEAAHGGVTLESVAAARVSDETVAYEALLAEQRLLPPLDHPDPAHCLVTGTGLSHLGSAQARDEMHAKLSGDAAELSDSMKMFKMGLEGGKPAPGAIGVQPEWFWKGDGSILVGCGRPLRSPPFAEDAGEEGEIAGLYVIGADGRPFRVGFALGNEFADHVMERRNYLYLAHSKLRPCALGPELLCGPLPEDVTGMIRVRRGAAVLWEAEMLSGEANMSHSIANLEHHHFKYPLFRRPGDVHVHFFGAGVLSFPAGIQARAGDVFEIEAPPFGRPLQNPLALEEGKGGGPVAVTPL